MGAIGGGLGASANGGNWVTGAIIGGVSGAVVGGILGPWAGPSAGGQAFLRSVTGVLGNPLTYTDPDGLVPLRKWRTDGWAPKTPTGNCAIAECAAGLLPAPSENRTQSQIDVGQCKIVCQISLTPGCAMSPGCRDAVGDAFSSAGNAMVRGFTAMSDALGSLMFSRGERGYAGNAGGT